MRPADDSSPIRQWRPPGRDWEAVSIVDAYNELGHRTFAIWIRLHACLPQHLKLGRAKLSRMLRVSKSTFNRAVRELVEAGYLVIDSRANKTRTVVRLIRKARAGKSTMFIKV